MNFLILTLSLTFINNFNIALIYLIYSFFVFEYIKLLSIYIIIN